jgi:hypothetical protein
MSSTVSAQRPSSGKRVATNNIKKTSKTRNSRNTPAECPKVYLGLDLGINNPNGLVGISLDVPLIPHMSARAGVGRSSWGWKYFGEVRGYLGECHRSWAAGAGVSHNTGINGFEAEMPTTLGNAIVKMDLYRQTNAFVNLYKFWTIGQKNNRFNIMLGYSIPLHDVDYKVTSYHTLSDDGHKTIKAIAPHGLSIGVGFSFELAGGGSRY